MKKKKPTCIFLSCSIPSPMVTHSVKPTQKNWCPGSAFMEATWSPWFLGRSPAVSTHLRASSTSSPTPAPTGRCLLGDASPVPPAPARLLPHLQTSGLPNGRWEDSRRGCAGSPQGCSLRQVLSKHWHHLCVGAGPVDRHRWGEELAALLPAPSLVMPPHEDLWQASVWGPGLWTPESLCSWPGDVPFGPSCFPGQRPLCQDQETPFHFSIVGWPYPGPPGVSSNFQRHRNQWEVEPCGDGATGWGGRAEAGR